MILTCIDFGHGKIVGYGQLAEMQALKRCFHDRNMLLTCINVELRGVEPLTSCMPCNKSNAPAWASTAPTWTYCALECP